MRLERFIRCLQRDVPDILEYLYDEADNPDVPGKKEYHTRAERHLPLGLCNWDEWMREDGRSRKDYGTKDRLKYYPQTQNIARMFLYQHIIKIQEQIRFKML